ncbi:hypothetical protein DPMN_103996 [Dreissena polymorpha]|uniref:Uncharacterized protein n=1 Tax=Dreissena polymorpha TaxID=45954 RepID=A0A9D4HAS7_DREPO|nr:hypothetical protein DPMN_103996 [Dreissena polymorpha]
MYAHFSDSYLFNCVFQAFNLLTGCLTSTNHDAKRWEVVRRVEKSSKIPTDIELEKHF